MLWKVALFSVYSLTTRDFVCNLCVDKNDKILNNVALFFAHGGQAKGRLIGPVAKRI